MNNSSEMLINKIRTAKKKQYKHLVTDLAALSLTCKNTSIDTGLIIITTSFKKALGNG